MGIDAGFDMVPRLTKSAPDTQAWADFVTQVRDRYSEDRQVDVTSNYLLFKAGEHPKLPFEGHKFLRFSSKVSGSIAASTHVGEYIRTVTRMARAQFGSRAQAWSESADQYGHYDWPEVYETIKSYDERDEDEVPMSMAGLTIGTNLKDELPALPYEIRTIPGRGRGLVARRDIPEGSRILVEKPLLVAKSLPRESLETLLSTKLKSLSKAEQRQVLSLHNHHPGKYPFSGIFRTNALSCGSGSDVGGVYATICLINHSCLPNAHNNWNPDSSQETIHAIRAISIGEEITICYSNEGPSADRRTKLRQSFGFDCGCVVCSLPPDELKASDARRLQIQQLDNAVGDPFQMMHNPTASLANCKSVLDLLKKEHGKSGGALYARVYYDAFQISIAHGDQARGAVLRPWVERSNVRYHSKEWVGCEVLSDLSRTTRWDVNSNWG